MRSAHQSNYPRAQSAPYKTGKAMLSKTAEANSAAARFCEAAQEASGSGVAFFLDTLYLAKQEKVSRLEAKNKI